ncbi:ATP-binding protein [Streptomyces sp. NPDC054863]
MAVCDPRGGTAKSLEDCGEAELLQLTIRRFTERRVGEALLSDGFLSDGSVLHEWIYAKTRLALGRSPDEHARPATARRTGPTAVFEEAVDQIGQLALAPVEDGCDLVVHLPAHGPLADSPVGEAFHAISDELLLEALGQVDVPSVSWRVTWKSACRNAGA